MHFVDFVNGNVLTDESLEKFSNAFDSVTPFSHVVIENFLKDDIAHELSVALQKADFIDKESDLFSFSQTDDLYYSDGILKEFNSALLHWDFFHFVELVTGVELSGTLSMSASRYSFTNRLLCHDDLVEGRRIAYVLYLTDGFVLSDGGRFLLFSSKNGDAEKMIKGIIPKFNSLLLFEVSGTSFHAVEENYSEKDRYSIGGWLE